MKKVFCVLLVLNALVVLICLLSSAKLVLQGFQLAAMHSLLLAINSAIWFGILLMVLDSKH